MLKPLAFALACAAMPAFGQSTTTVTTQQQPEAVPPPPPPSTSTTVTTQQNPYPPPTSSVTSVETVPTGRSAVAIVATDALYGGLAGVAIGGGVTLIDQGDHWQRDLMVGAGIGILAGAAFGIFEAATQPKAVVRAAADRNSSASDIGTEVAVVSGRF